MTKDKEDSVLELEDKRLKKEMEKVITKAREARKGKWSNYRVRQIDRVDW